jgi:antitoxin PrlF
MHNFTEAELTLTDRYQTTVPEPVRRALRLGKRDKIHYTIRPDGEVVLRRVSDEDPALTAFLTFIADDIEAHPSHLQPLDAGLLQRAATLVAGVEVNLDAPLAADE